MNQLLNHDADLDADLDGAVRTSRSSVPFERLLGVEWTKATDTRSARWLLLITGLATIGLTTVAASLPGSVDQNWSSYLQHGVLVMSLLLPILAVLTITNEWSQRTVLTTFVHEPRRGRVFAAKSAVSVLLSLAGVVVIAVCSVVAIGFVTAFTGRDVTNDLSGGLIAGLVLTVVLNALMGVAFGAVLQNSISAIVLFFGLPAVFGLLAIPLGHAGDWLDPSRPFTWMTENDWSGHIAPMAVSLTLWIGAPLVLGLVRTLRREIN